MTKDMINNGVNSDDKSRIIQEYVPGKQITLAHMVTRPKASVYKKLGLPDDYHDAIGILTITPSEATIIAADICTKAASIKLGFVDRFSGSVIIVGSTSNVESALNSVITTFYNKLGFDTVSITKTRFRYTLVWRLFFYENYVDWSVGSGQDYADSASY